MKKGIFLMVCSTILLGSCGTPKPSTHEHTFDTVYKYDDKVQTFLDIQTNIKLSHTNVMFMKAQSILMVCQ